MGTAQVPPLAACLLAEPRVAAAHQMSDPPTPASTKNLTPPCPPPCSHPGNPPQVYLGIKVTDGLPFRNVLSHMLSRTLGARVLPKDVRCLPHSLPRPRSSPMRPASVRWGCGITAMMRPLPHATAPCDPPASPGPPTVAAGPAAPSSASAHVMLAGARRRPACHTHPPPSPTLPPPTPPACRQRPWSCKCCVCWTGVWGPTAASPATWVPGEGTRAHPPNAQPPTAQHDARRCHPCQPWRTAARQRRTQASSASRTGARRPRTASNNVLQWPDDVHRMISSTQRMERQFRAAGTPARA